MDEKAAETAIVPAQADLHVALRGAVSLRVSATTSESKRRADLLRDKQRIVLSFFRHTGKLPSEVESADMQGWVAPGLEEKGNQRRIRPRLPRIVFVAPMRDLTVLPLGDRSSHGRG
jgi:hypothetical protein